jgi:dienelactone hydrolase
MIIKAKLLAFYVALSGLLAMSGAVADVRTATIDYQHEGVKLQGFLAWDDATQAPRPGVLVVHEWWGLNDYARSRAVELAKQGYAAFALDMYGQGKVTTHPDQASTWMKQVQQNVEQWVERANAGLQVFSKHPAVDANRLAAIGYCFGGATVMHMAYAGLDLAAVASFHGSLPVADAQASDIRARILVAHGNADPFVPAEKVESFKQALDGAGADWTLMVFGGVKHSFTNPSAGDYAMEALAYDENADRQSWQMLLWLLEDAFR